MVFPTQHLSDVVTPEAFSNLLSFKSFQELKGRKENFVLAIYVRRIRISISSSSAQINTVLAQG